MLSQLALGIGMLKLWGWARWLILLGAGLLALLQIVRLVFPLSLGSPWLWLGLLGVPGFPLAVYVLVILGSPALGFMWSGLLFWYFLRPGVKAQFVSREQ